MIRALRRPVGYAALLTDCLLFGLGVIGMIAADSWTAPAGMLVLAALAAVAGWGLFSVGGNRTRVRERVSRRRTGRTPWRPTSRSGSTARASVIADG
jgi:hypothetical protein